MKLFEIIKDIDVAVIAGSTEVEITGINIDTRFIEQGNLFVATVGRSVDSHHLIANAINQGAAAILIQQDHTAEVIQAVQESSNPAVTILSVDYPRSVLSRLVNQFYHNPADAFELIGVTGTNGKTSVATILDDTVRNLGLRTGLLGTIENYCNGHILQTRRTTPTTPDAIELGEIMNVMRQEEVDAMIMEVSSMGLMQGRVDALTFDVGIFTNISPEHLDDHGSMEAYQQAKAKLFDLTENCVINVDDAFGSKLATLLSLSGDKQVITYGINTDKNPSISVYAKDISYTQKSVNFDVVIEEEQVTRHVTLDIPSEFAVYNALAVYATCLALDITIDDAIDAMGTGIQVAGRYDVITPEHDDRYSVIIDYAHTNGALENLLKTVKNNPAYDYIISVFGCGGDRDPSKREPMGETSGTLADYTIITSDNPRTEDPFMIIDQVERGVQKSQGNYEIVEDRKRAIETGIALAKQRNSRVAVVVAGKGHEDYQIIGTEHIHLDDKEVVLEFIKNDKAQ
ncbi:MAG: UDP-N-acetylmuramoyl-L-alanyl-D-glutamate--2,6-diaminopimelate ligase [Clostridiales Family XIII bacterium]|jgi:UDP-N-acetylmuramoyl-L-alanyl-D-glutamate--2,6-diaminopimelate ligase|nr:UDP-N-acetylmuramoyl-L-alanyl-D-glutamate--2,6-diaminopimelate ligase [Clostridiales Family XIII bacterium]